MLSRRNFLKSGLITGAAGLPLTSQLNALDAPPAVAARETGAEVRLIELPPRMGPPDGSAEPWQKSVRRVGQTNMTEHDPAVMNVETWADYWHSAKADIVFVSVTGILAYYPSKVPFHKHGKYLNGRDFFGSATDAHIEFFAPC
jgi:hypothetical protein